MKQALAVLFLRTDTYAGECWPLRANLVCATRQKVPIRGRGGGWGAGAGVYHTRYGLYHGAPGQLRPVSQGDIP